MTNPFKPIVPIALALGLAVVVAPSLDAQTFSVIYNLESITDGVNAHAPLLLSNGVLYGTASQLNGAGAGTVFKINTNGSGFAVLEYFSNTANENGGAFPHSELVLSGGALYGTASQGGDNSSFFGYGSGTVFKVNTDGSGFNVLHTFEDSDGLNPGGGVAFSGNTIYGQTFAGGGLGQGAIFKINTDGSGFAVIHNFTDGPSDGASPYADLTLAGGVLYGAGYNGGSIGWGTVFKMSTDGSTCTVLHNFTGGTTDGESPSGLCLSGGTLYGATERGGSHSVGTIFKVNTDGTGYTILHNFSGSDGQIPTCGVVMVGGILYGPASQGGPGGNGVIFQINPDGSGYAIAHAFAASGLDGTIPEARLTLSGSTLYGITAAGGNRNGGTIFQLTLPAPAPTPSIRETAVAGKILSLSWPASATGYSLETSATLGAGASWSIVNGAVISGTNFVYTNSINNHSAFFRLHHQ